MHGVLTHASLARIPAEDLPLLGGLRAYASVEVRLDGTHAWVRWSEAGYEILRALLPVRCAEFFEKLDRHWHLCGHSLPAFEVPDDGFVPLASVITPAPVLLVADDDEVLPRVVLALRRAEEPRPAVALLTTPKALAAWVDMASQAEIAALEAARSGELVLVTGERLPPLMGERYWGERLFCPLGWMPDPDLPESALLQALGVQAHELALLRKGAVEIIPRSALSSLSRASARLGAG
ncbi:MAG: hypothetical protein KDB90_04825 [Planctomycetes bacterium]|nr:hypothetical protein [Planctomycetota bacterium]